MATPPSMLARLPPLHVGAGLVVSAAFVAARVLHLRHCTSLGDAMASRARAFERPLECALRRVLVVGDSTGVGTGAEDPRHSLAGRLARDFPNVSIVNHARNGAKTRDAWEQLSPFVGESFDVVLVHVGGNDLLRRTPWQRLVADVDALLQRAGAIGRHVLVTTTPNVGLAPAFFAPLSWYLSARSRQLRDLVDAACRRHGSHYANFFHPRSCDPFSRDWQRYYAADRLHPSSACYGYVYATLLRETPLARWLACDSAAADRGANVDQLGEECDVKRLAEECDAG
jgi:lysophospholipase L1-like esterase